MDGAVFKLGKERFLNSGGAFHGLISNYRYQTSLIFFDIYKISQI